MTEKQSIEDRLIKAGNTKWSRRPDRSTSIGKAVDKYMRFGVNSMKRNPEVLDAWQEILPDELAEKCSIVSFKEGVITVEAPAGAFAFELQTVSNAVLRELKRLCPKAKITKIKIRTHGRARKDNRV